MQALSPTRTYAWWAALIALAGLRLTHAHLLWPDEDYHLAAAINILSGKVPYRDFWYDKPPLGAVYYVLTGGRAGVLLRLLDAAYILLACHLAFKLARACWGEAEGWIAGLLVAFFTAFYLPAAVIPFAVDALLIVPHLAAIYFAYERRAVWAGFFCGVGLLVNLKAGLVLGVCGLWLLDELPLLLAGLAGPLAVALAWLGWTGAWQGFYEQVWRWGLLYTRGAAAGHAWQAGLARVAGWAGFHCALLGGAAWGMPRLGRTLRWKMGVWVALSFASVCLGNRFAPRYFLQLLPPLAILAAHGIRLAWKQNRKVAGLAFGLLLLLPLARFGWRYAVLAADDLAGREPRWSDVVMDQDSRQVALVITQRAQANDTVFVWGYRPDIYVYTRRTSDNLFWDSQPLTGVAADRHLAATGAVYSQTAERNRLLFIQSRPVFVVDGLGLLNPALALTIYPETRKWLTQYEEVSRTKLSIIYQLKTPGTP
jgi:hypothetical protein